MSRDEIMRTLKSLALSQGSYGRLVEQIETSEDGDAILTHLEEQNFADAVDLIMYLEQ